MEMRIVVPDDASATVLADWLTVGFGSERISLRGDRREVDVLIDREPDRAILRAGEYRATLRALKQKPDAAVFAPLRAENAGCVNLPKP